MTADYWFVWRRVKLGLIAATSIEKFLPMLGVGHVQLIRLVSVQVHDYTSKYHRS